MANVRRQYTPEFKLQAVQMMTDQHLGVAEVARRLGGSESRLHEWKKAARVQGADAFPGVRPPVPDRGGEPAAAGREQAAGDGARHPEKSHGVLRHPREGILAWVEERRADYPVAVMCRALGVSRSGYDARRNRPLSDAAERRETLATRLREVHAEVKGRYGSPRLTAELNERGVPCCVNTVARVMTAHGIRAKTVRRFVRATDSKHRLPVAENVPGRNFSPVRPNAAWAADITYVPTREGWLFLALVVDLFSRRIVGWAMAATVTSRRVVDAPEMAVRQRRVTAGLVAHSDRGS